MIWPTWVLSQLWPFKITTKASPSRWRAILFAVVGILVDSHLVVVERYVVNNLRFDLGNPEENPYIRRKSDARRPSMGRKGSNAWKESNTRRESNARRAALRLGGLRVITSGGGTSGIDASLYLVSIMVSEEAANEIARVMQYTWIKGVVVDGIDI